MATFRRYALAAGLGLGAALAAAPAPAQNAVQNGVLVIYGNQKCPTDSQGREIVVCQRRDADEQFRIPKELREFQVTPENESWAAREQTLRDVGTTGVGSCSTVGPGGATGCFAQAARAAKKERQAREEAQSDIP
ncbi:MAG TPA: hypothetical protein VFT56_17445 [Sphingomonas sp.]|nr:hypothetical protein [Sphingomonas sp.]